MKRLRNFLGAPTIVLLPAILLAGLIGVHLLLPYVVDTEGVRQLIIDRAAGAYRGDIEFSRFKPALLPRPHVKISQGRLSDGDHIDLKISDAAVYLNIWPLFTGKLSIDRIKLIEPSWSVDIGFMHALGPAEGRTSPPEKKGMAALSPFIGFLGSARAEIDNGRLDLRRDGRSILTVSRFDSQIAASKGQLHLIMNGHTEVSSGFTLSANFDLRSLNGHGRLSISGLQSGVLGAIGLVDRSDDLPQASVDLGIDFNTYGVERVQARFDARASKLLLGRGGRQVTLGAITANGRVGWTPHKVDIALTHLQSASPAVKATGSFVWNKIPTIGTAPIQLSLKSAGFDVSPMRDLLLKCWGAQPEVVQVMDIVRGGQISSLDMSLSASHWEELKEMRRLRVEGRVAGGRIVVPEDLFDLKQVGGRVVITGGRLTATEITARQGSTIASSGALTMGLYDGSKGFSLDALIDTEVMEIPKVLRRLTGNRTVLDQLDRLPPMTGRASGRLRVGDRLDRPAVDITAKADIQTDQSNLHLVGSVSGLNGDQPSAKLFMKGRMGAVMLGWAEGLMAQRPEIALKAPFTVAGADLVWAPASRIRFNGVLDWDDGARIGAAMTVSENDIHLQRLHIKDAASNALISFRSSWSGRLLDARFSGYLEKPSLDRLVKTHRIGSGTLQGRFRLQLNRDYLERSAMDGHLAARDIELLPENGEAIHIVGAAIEGHGRQFDLRRSQFLWGKDRISVAGGGRLVQKAIDVKGTVRADAAHTNKLMAIIDRHDSLRPAQSKSPATGTPIPVRGKVSVEIGQLTHDRYQFAPFHAVVDFKERDTLIDVTDAKLCGIQMPGQIRLKDGMARLALAPQAKATSLKDAGNCLLDSPNSEKLLGTLNLNGAITAQGNNRETLLSNLKGKVDFTIKKGRVSNVGSAGVFTNLLSYLSVNQYVEGDLPDLRKNDFIFKRIESRWVFGDGVLRIEEGMLKSNAVNMVAEGRYDLLNEELDLNVLVSPLTTVDWIVERIPLLGNILQGTLVAIPVRVKGPQNNPSVVPLSPAAVGARLGGILERTLKTPVRIIEPLLKDDAEQPPQGGK